MVSKPDFDPNQIEEEWDYLLSDNESGTLLNRVTQGLYPPGSTFKIVDCIDILREDPEIAEDYRYDCTGVFEKGGESIHCYDYEVHGNVDLKESFAHSCNASFANLGVNEIDPESMSETLRFLLFNQKLPYDLPYVRSSINMPDTLSTEGICVNECKGSYQLKDGHLTLVRFDADHGTYKLFVEEADTCDGPKTTGNYVWFETKDWGKWEDKLMYGPYIHHIAGVYGSYKEVFREARI